MSEYDAWAPVYDAWASDMTEDVAHYVSLAREADGPIVELMVGSGGERLLLEVVGIHDGDLIQRFLLLSRARERRRSRPGSYCGGDDALLARRRPGNEPGLHKGERARSRHWCRYYPR